MSGWYNITVKWNPIIRKSKKKKCVLMQQGGYRKCWMLSFVSCKPLNQIWGRISSIFAFITSTEEFQKIKKYSCVRYYLILPTFTCQSSKLADSRRLMKKFKKTYGQLLPPIPHFILSLQSPNSAFYFGSRFGWSSASCPVKSSNKIKHTLKFIIIVLRNQISFNNGKSRKKKENFTKSFDIIYLIFI